MKETSILSFKEIKDIEKLVKDCAEQARIVLPGLIKKIVDFKVEYSALFTIISTGSNNTINFKSVQMCLGAFIQVVLNNLSDATDDTNVLIKFNDLCEKLDNCKSELAKLGTYYAGDGDEGNLVHDWFEQQMCKPVIEMKGMLDYFLNEDGEYTTRDHLEYFNYINAISDSTFKDTIEYSNACLNSAAEGGSKFNAYPTIGSLLLQVKDLFIEKHHYEVQPKEGCLFYIADAETNENTQVRLYQHIEHAHLVIYYSYSKMYEGLNSHLYDPQKAEIFTLSDDEKNIIMKSTADKANTIIPITQFAKEPARELSPCSVGGIFPGVVIGKRPLDEAEAAGNSKRLKQ